LSILTQIDEALGKIASHAEWIRSSDDFTSSPAGMEKLDSICMLFMAIGGFEEYRQYYRRGPSVTISQNRLEGRNRFQGHHRPSLL